MAQSYTSIKDGIFNQSYKNLLRDFYNYGFKYNEDFGRPASSLSEDISRLGERPRIRNKDLGNIAIKEGDKVEVCFIETRTNAKGITYTNYKAIRPIP